MCDPQSQTGRNTLQLSEQKGDTVNPEATVKSSQAVGTNQPLYCEGVGSWRTTTTG